MSKPLKPWASGFPRLRSDSLVLPRSWATLTDPISAPSRQRLRELDQLLVKAVADLHGPANLVERLASAGRLLGLLLLLAGVAYALLLIATHEMVHLLHHRWNAGCSAIPSRCAVCCCSSPPGARLRT